jgi:hypothetical protein
MSEAASRSQRLALDALRSALIESMRRSIAIVSGRFFLT